jgi:3',5'-nucleoside bisphosphate phosphatase
MRGLTLNDLTQRLVLNPDAAIDLQLHTVNSDGKWTPEALIDHLVQEQFALVAITDHDRVDTVAEVQRLGAQKGLPILSAVEMTTIWHEEMTDILCYGFDPDHNELNDLAQDVAHRQSQNTQVIYQILIQLRCLSPHPKELALILKKPSSQQPHELAAFLKRYVSVPRSFSLQEIIKETATTFIGSDPAQVVEAAHRSGAVCILAHPGRDDGFVPFDIPRLDRFRQEVPIDGIEVYYPLHTPEQTAMYLDYAIRHNLLMSSGSDSHKPEKPPIKYRAELSRALLERLAIQFQ